MKEKTGKICYGDISVNHVEHLDGGGSIFGQDFIPVVKEIFGKVPRICEFACGPGYIGFSLLAHGLCDSLCLIDINPEAVEICKKTIKENKLEDKVSVYLSDGLSDVPLTEKWDLVVSNPPHASKFPDEKFRDWNLRSVDSNFEIHEKFYSKVNGFLKPDASILFQENIFGSMPWIHTDMIIKNNLEFVRCFWHKKFNSVRDALIMFSHLKRIGIIHYYKTILKEIIKPSGYRLYFVWSRKIT